MIIMLAQLGWDSELGNKTSSERKVKDLSLNKVTERSVTLSLNRYSWTYCVERTINTNIYFIITYIISWFSLY